jgi:hypothetical protein
MSIIVKNKIENSSNMRDIYDKLNVTTNYTYLITTVIQFITTTHILQFHTLATGRSSSGT